MKEVQMSNENPYFGNVVSGPRFYDGQLRSRGGNQTRGGGRRGGFSGRPGTVTEIPVAVPRRAGGVQGRGAGVLMRGVRVLRNGVPGRGAVVPRSGAGVPKRARGVLARGRGVAGRGAGVLSKGGGVLGRGGGIPVMLGVPPRINEVSVGTGGVSGLDGSCRVNQGGENASMRAPGNMGRYMFSYNGIKKGEIVSRSDSATGNLASRSPQVKSSLLTRGGGYGLNGGSSFTSRGSFVRKGQDRVALKKGFEMATRGGASMTTGGALCRGGIGMSRGGGIGQIRGIATVKDDIRDVQLTRGLNGGQLTQEMTRDVQLAQGVTRGVQLNQEEARGVQLNQEEARGVQQTQGVTRGVQRTEGVGDMARTSGMGMRRGGLNSSGGAGLNKGGGGFNGAIGVTRNGGFNGSRVMARGGSGFNGAVGVTRDGGFSGSRVMAGGGSGFVGVTGDGGFSGGRVMARGGRECNGVVGVTRDDVFSGSRVMDRGGRGCNGTVGVTRDDVFSGSRVMDRGGRECNGAVGVTRDDVFSGSRVMDRGGRGCNRAMGKRGNSTAGVMTGVVPHSEKISTPRDTTSHTSHIKREIEVIDLDETADIVEEKTMINVQNVNQEPLSEEDIRDRYYGGLNNYEENGFDIKSNQIGDQLTVMKNDADGSLKLVMKATVNPNITVSIVNDKMSSSNNNYQECEQSETDDKVMKGNKIKENDRMNTEYIKNVNQVEMDDIKDEDIKTDSVVMSVSRNTDNTDSFKKPTELCSFAKIVDTVTVDDVIEVSDRIEINDKTERNFVMFQNSVESNSLQVENSWVNIDAIKLIIEGTSPKPSNVNGEEILFERKIDVIEADQNCYILEVDPTKGNCKNDNVKCVAENSPIKYRNQVTGNSPRSQYQMKGSKRKNMLSESSMEMDGDFLPTDQQSWKERNSSLKPSSQMAQNYTKSQYQVKASQKKCFINVEKLNISPGDTFIEVGGVSYKVNEKPNSNDAKKKKVKSWVWKYMTQEPVIPDMATGGVRKAVCNLCSISIKYGYKTSGNLARHLRCSHDEDIEVNERKDDNYWMLRYANLVTENGNMVSSSGSVPGRKRYVCKLCSNTVSISHFLMNFELLHRDKLKAM